MADKTQSTLVHQLKDIITLITNMTGKPVPPSIFDEFPPDIRSQIGQQAGPKQAAAEVANHARAVEWFEHLFGFDEDEALETGGMAAVQAKFVLGADGTLKSLVNNTSYGAGSFAARSLTDLRKDADERAKTGKLPLGQLSFEHAATTDVYDMHTDPRYKGATIMAASQFNALEFINNDIVPEDGVTNYVKDPTQGPACALAAPAAAVFRNYFVPMPSGALGQSKNDQLNLLSDLLLRVQNTTGNYTRAAKQPLVEVRNGYTKSDGERLKKLNKKIKQLTGEQNARDELLGALRVGLHSRVEVPWAQGDRFVLAAPAQRQKRSQVFCSAIACKYSAGSIDAWEPLARLVLDAAYEATLLAAVLEAADANKSGGGGIPVVLLTFLGGGVFGNKNEWIDQAIARAVVKMRERGVALRVVVSHFGKRIDTVRKKSLDNAIKKELSHVGQKQTNGNPSAHQPSHINPIANRHKAEALAINRLKLEKEGLPVGWDPKISLNKLVLTEHATTLIQQIAHRRPKARIVDYWGGSHDTRERLSNWLKLLGFEVEISSGNTQIGDSCGVVAARALTKLEAAGDRWMTDSTTDATARIWIQIANKTLFEEESSEFVDQRTRIIATEEMEGVIEQFRRQFSHHIQQPPWSTEHDIGVPLDVLYTRVLADLTAADPVTRYMISNTSLSTEEGLHWFCVVYSVDAVSPQGMAETPSTPPPRPGKQHPPPVDKSKRKEQKHFQHSVGFHAEDAAAQNQEVEDARIMSRPLSELSVPVLQGRVRALYGDDTNTNLSRHDLIKMIEQYEPAKNKPIGNDGHGAPHTGSNLPFTSMVLNPVSDCCPDGKELNAATGRCRQKCKEGKKRNPKGNCIPIECPEGKEMNPKTSRCRKKRIDGEERNQRGKGIQQLIAGLPQHTQQAIIDMMNGNPPSDKHVPFAQQAQPNPVATRAQMNRTYGNVPLAQQTQSQPVAAGAQAKRNFGDVLERNKLMARNVEPARPANVDKPLSELSFPVLQAKFRTLYGNGIATPTTRADLIQMIERKESAKNTHNPRGAGVAAGAPMKRTFANVPLSQQAQKPTGD